MRFFTCLNCNQVFIKLVDHDNHMTCCDSQTEELSLNSAYDSSEDHLPIVRKIGNFVTITIGQNHPMIDVHYIEFICLKTTQGFHYKKMEKHQPAQADFILAKDEEIITVYTYCNVHQLWSLNK